MAAAAIAMHGGYHGPISDASKKNWTSYQFYAAGYVSQRIYSSRSSFYVSLPQISPNLPLLNHPRTSSSPWDIHNHTADYVGDRLALFALGSLVTMANLNRLISVEGDVPHLGHSVQIYEPGFTILCACIVGVHLAVFLATVLSGWRTEQETPGTELHGVDSRVEGNESRRQLVGEESRGGDFGWVEEGGSIRREEPGVGEERGVEEQETPGQRGFQYV